MSGGNYTNSFPDHIHWIMTVKIVSYSFTDPYVHISFYRCPHNDNDGYDNILKIYDSNKIYVGHRIHLFKLDNPVLDSHRYQAEETINKISKKEHPEAEHIDLIAYALKPNTDFEKELDEIPEKDDQPIRNYQFLSYIFDYVYQNLDIIKTGKLK